MHTMYMRSCLAVYYILAGYPALLGPLPLYFSLPIRYSFLPSLPRITRLRPEYLQCNITQDNCVPEILFKT